MQNLCINNPKRNWHSTTHGETWWGSKGWLEKLPLVLKRQALGPKDMNLHQTNVVLRYNTRSLRTVKICSCTDQRWANTKWWLITPPTALPLGPGLKHPSSDLREGGCSPYITRYGRRSSSELLSPMAKTLVRFSGLWKCHHASSLLLGAAGPL